MTDHEKERASIVADLLARSGVCFDFCKFYDLPFVMIGDLLKIVQ